MLFIVNVEGAATGCMKSLTRPEELDSAALQLAVMQSSLWLRLIVSGSFA